MKASRSILFLAAAMALATILPLTIAAAATPADPGAYDFGSFDVPTGGGEYVEVDVPRSLIALAAHFVGPDEPEVAALLAGLERVRVHVIGIDDANREDLAARITRSREDLTQAGWQRVVTVRDQGESVDVYLKMGAEEKIDGIVVTVLDQGGEAVFVNVVGNIRPEQLATLGQRFGIEPLREINLPAGRKG